VLAQQDREGDDRDQKQRRSGGDCRPVLAAFADDKGDEGRRSLRLTGSEEYGERIFVPGEDQAEDRCRGDAGSSLRQHDLAECLQARIAVDHCGFFVFARNFVDEALQQPDCERDVYRRVKQDHSELRIGKAKLAIHEVDRDRDRDWGHHPGRQDKEQKVVLQRHLETRETICG
jgi:hypothetical protein